MKTSKQTASKDYSYLSPVNAGADSEALSTDAGIDFTPVFAAYYKLEMVVGKAFGARHHEGCHYHIPAANSRFISRLKTAIDYFATHLPDQKPSFLDVGCGFGIKLLIARDLGCDVSGIEINKKYAHVATLMLMQYKRPFGIVHNIDAFQFTEYARYNIIYWYTPLDDYKKMDELETKLVNEASPGTILIPIVGSRLAVDCNQRPIACLEELADSVFLKK